MIANRNIEQIVLGTIMGNSKATAFVNMLEVTDFDDPHHQMIFQAVHVLADQGRHASPIFLAQQFKDDLIGDQSRPLIEYIKDLAAKKTVAVDALVDYIRSLKEFTGRRMMAAMGQQMIEVAVASDISVQDFLDEVAEASSKAASAIRQQRVTSFTLGQLHDIVMADLKQKRDFNLVPSGIAALDKIMGGWPRGELSIIAGRPSMGKSTAAWSGLRQAADRHGVTGIFFSMEMKGASMHQRALSDAVWNSQTPIEYERIMRGDLHEHEIARIDAAGDRLRNLNIEVEEQDALSMAEIGIRARRYADALVRRGLRLDTLVIDQLSFVQASGRYRGNRVHEVGEVSRGVKALAKELDCAAVLLCQLNRKSEDREDKRPQMADLRDSGDLEQDADTVMFCYRIFYYLERMGVQTKASAEEFRQSEMAKNEYRIEFIIAKRRNGQIFNAHADAFMGSNAIRSLLAR